MADLGAFFGNPNLQRQGARARALAAQRDVNTLADPLTYAAVQGLLGTRPDEMGFSVLNPNYEKIKKVAEPAFALGLLGQASPLLAPMTKGLPVGASIKNVGKFDVVKRDASDIFGEGAQRIRYTDPKSGGSIDVLARPDGSASVLGLEVPEKFRGKGIGESLQKQVLQDFPDMQGQVSSKAAATTAYRIGRRPPNMPNATLDDVYRMIDEDSSVNMISPQMQQRIAPTSETGLLGQAAPALAPLTKGLPVGASIENVGKDLSAIKIGDRTIPVTINRIDKKSGGQLVNVNPSAFDEAFSKTSWQYVGEKGKEGISGRYEKFENYLKDAKSIEASNVSVNKDGGIVFGDGRHRYAVLRDMGLDELPIVMDKESIKNAKKFGYLSDISSCL